MAWKHTVFVIILIITMLEVLLHRAQGLVISGGLVALGNYLQGYSIYGQKMDQILFQEGNMIYRKL